MKLPWQHNSPQAIVETVQPRLLSSGLVAPLLYLLPLGLIFDLTGYLPPYLRLFLIYALLGLAICLAGSGRWVGRSAWGLAGVMILQALLRLPPVAELSLLLLGHQAVWHFVRPVAPRLRAGLLFYFLLHLWLFLSPAGYAWLETGMRAGNGVSGWLTGGSYHLGYTYQNLGAFFLFLSLSVFGWDRSRLSKARTASYLAVVFFLNGLLSMVLIRQVNFGADMVWELKYRDVFGYGELFGLVKGLVLLVYPALVFLAYLAAYLVLHQEAWQQQGGTPGETKSTGPWWFKPTLPGTARQAGILGGAVLFALLIIPPTSWRRPSTCELLFVERGVVSFTKPDYTRFGRAAGGMYGLLPEYARLFGCEARVIKDIPESLEEGKVLVMTNLDQPLSREEQARIWDFVGRGGRLWVLGDHTFIKNGRNHINDLLAPCHIALKHDSAQFFPQGWFNCYRFREGTPFSGLRDEAENRPAILVGASLDVRLPAQPFIVGRFGYSDWGVTEEEDNRGYIGDFKYQAEERLGDLVLVAGEQYGKGKVLVFGDTTSFFNNNLSRSYELLRSTLSWLGEARGWSWIGFGAGRLVVGALLLGLFALVFICRLQPVLGGVLAGVLAVSWLAHRPTGWLPFDRQVGREKLALLDFAHQPFTSKHGSMGSSLHGVSVNLMRYGLLPAAINDWNREMLEAARLVVLNAPQRPFSRSERGDLMAFMERGGIVLMGCGFAHYQNNRSLLDKLQLEVTGLPLGRFFDRPAFGRAVSFHSAWPIVLRHPQGKVLCVYDDWPLMVEVPVGNGRFILIGDSEFLHNRNLEGFETYDPANVQFIRSLLDHVMQSPNGKSGP